MLDNLRAEGVDIDEEAHGRRDQRQAGRSKCMPKMVGLQGLASVDGCRAQGQYRQARPGRGGDRDDRSGIRWMTACARPTKRSMRSAMWRAVCNLRMSRGIMRGSSSARCCLVCRPKQRQPYPLGHLYRPRIGPGRSDRSAGARESMATAGSRAL